MDLYYLWQIHGENLIEFLIEAFEIIAIGILLYNEWVRRIDRKEKEKCQTKSK
jgi:diphthamide synthase (EF-2-diphthine--ammonia ligase)